MISYGGIDILTDARHGWRKNSRQADVVCLGSKTGQVIQLTTVTSSRDEKIGTRKTYDSLRVVRIRRHYHGNNVSFTIYAHENHPKVRNQVDKWHDLKSQEKLLTNSVRGAKKSNWMTWHRELDDKLSSLWLHALYAMRNCGNDAELLRELLLISVTHYQNDHSKCMARSQCGSTSYYEPSKLMAPKAIKLLKAALKSSHLHLNSELRSCKMGAATVDSFTHYLNMFQNKRISFNDDSYLVRSLYSAGTRT